MMRNVYTLICICSCCLLSSFSFGKTHASWVKDYMYGIADTTEDELSQEVTDSLKRILNVVTARRNSPDSVDIELMNKNPYISVAQFVKGAVSGLYVQEPSGEPGSLKNIVWRGLSSPLLANRNVNAVQPTIYVNGVPLAQESSFAFDIQRYQFNKIGTETDLFTRVDMNAIKSIEVIRDPVKLAELGPLAANGAIWIITKSGKSGPREIAINSYYGFTQKTAVTPINAEYENMFRQPFYAKYGDLNDRLRYPGYLSDSTNMNYYGPADWSDLYYKNNPLYAVDMSLTGGSDRANFSFHGGHKSNAGNADNTKFKGYTALFSVNMAPFEWFTVSALINANRSERQRNKNLRDRYAETAYLPDLSTPLSPNRHTYAYYLDQFNGSLDDNIMNAVNGFINFKFKIIKDLSYESRLAIDYTEGIRDVFWPSTLMEGSNFVSNFFGYSQRLVFSNYLNYSLKVNPKSQLNLHLGSDYVMDLYRYNYARAYDGPNDFVKINVVNGNAAESDYLLPKGGLNVYRWNNKDQFRMQSFYGRAKYSYANILEAEALIRFDGASTVQPDSRWLFTPAANVSWNLKEHLLSGESPFSSLKLNLGAGRIARPISGARYATGPQYSTNMGWSTEPGLVSFNGFAGISRPYNSGWIGYDIDWPYSDQMNLSMDATWWQDRAFATLALYNKSDKNQIVEIPVPNEYGYKSQHVNGMTVQNRGVELTLGATILQNPNGVQWKTSVNASFNKNRLTALPRGLDELVIGDRKLKVGAPIDQFWLYENEGIYERESDIPVNQSGRKLAFDGIYLNAGDPIWKDSNGDFNVDEQDKVMKGQATPKVFGGWANQISYKGFDLGVQLYFAAGHKLLNQRASTRYDFINNESNNSIQSVREIFHWQQDIDIEKYPIYNPWSSVVPYRVDQDLFLENASFLKLRSLSIGYDLSALGGLKERLKTLRRAYVYVSGTNLHTWTGFSGLDPELVEFNGYYTGYGQPLAPTYTLGIKLDL